MDHKEFSRKGGASRSQKKLKAVRNNLAKAREAKQKSAKQANVNIVGNPSP
jgi:hypothetical protein